jgi:hypothetical protein
MSAGEPTPEEARTAIAEAAKARLPVRSSDRLFAVRLFAIAASVVLASIVIVFLTSLPPVLGPVEGVIAGLTLALALFLTVAAAARQRAFTRAGNRLFTATLLLFIVWAEVVWQAATHSDWLSYTQARPLRALHFVLMAVIAVVPLLAGAVVFRFRR